MRILKRDENLDIMDDPLTGHRGPSDRHLWIRIPELRLVGPAAS